MSIDLKETQGLTISTQKMMRTRNELPEKVVEAGKMMTLRSMW